MLERLSRRTLVAGGLGAAAASVFGSRGLSSRQRPKRFRVVHLTDSHLTPTVDCGQRFVDCMAAVATQKPDVIFQGGDLVMDGLDLDKGKVQAEWDFALALLRSHCPFPVEHCIGNHDVWAWARRDRAQLENDPMYGKGWWLRLTGYGSTYRSFDRGGWHFIFLDSIGHTPGPGYAAYLDHDQFRWLEVELAKTPADQPVCIVSHIPILSIAAHFFDPHSLHPTGWHIPGHLMHCDARRLKDLFVRHPNVKVALSGHLHMTCKVDYANVSHISSGAVSGAWWKGPMQETKPGFGVVDFYPDGGFRSKYVVY